MWIHIPAEFYPCVPELAESNWDLNSLCQQAEQSLMLRSKPMRAKSWLNAWKKKSWMKHLFGQILNPSMANRGVEKWILSLEVTPANHFQLQERNSETKTHDTFGLMYGELFPKLNPQSASSKMSADIYNWALSKSMMTYKDWAIRLRRGCLQRKKSVLRIAEKGSLSWPTATTADAAVAETVTPNDTYVPTKNGTLRRYLKTGHNCSLGLARTAKLWQTVVVSEANGIAKREITENNKKSRLRAEALLWDQREKWPTPRAQEPGSTSPNYGKGLKLTAIHWRTPNASDAEGGIMEIRPETSARIKLRDHSVHITNCLSGHPDQLNINYGEISQKTLNPQFTEWLMGWPIGWTGLEPVEMVWSHWWLRMRLELSRLTLSLQQQEI